MALLAFVIYAFVGVAAGLLAGLLGIGGGLVTVPALFLLFHLMDFPSTHLMQVAVGTSLAAMVFTASSSAWSHHLLRGINWSFFRVLSPGIVLGAIVGAVVADSISSRSLQIVFGISESLIGIYFILPHQNLEESNIIFPGRPLLFLVLGIGIGFISSILGIGGGIVTVPLLVASRVPLKNAISTSAATGLLIAWVSAVSFLILGLKQVTFSETVGYVYIPAFFCIGITATFTAPYGARLAYSLPTETLRRLFGIVLIIVGFSFLI